MLAGVLSNVSNSRKRAHWRGRDRGVSITIPAKNDYKRNGSN